ncbi:MAG TPA: DUF6171 family protein [Clostridia bacterium]|nr:DUF6171 family protein [Clostridia bacterium]
MSNKTLCKGCTASTRVEIDETYEKLREAFIDETMVACKETYQKRLETCKACPALQYGTTCQYCGCLVHARALNKDNYCPNPSAPRW